MPVNSVIHERGFQFGSFPGAGCRESSCHRGGPENARRIFPSHAAARREMLRFQAPTQRQNLPPILPPDAGGPSMIANRTSATVCHFRLQPCARSISPLVQAFSQRAGRTFTGFQIRDAVVPGRRCRSMSLPEKPRTSSSADRVIGCFALHVRGRSLFMRVVFFRHIESCRGSRNGGLGREESSLNATIMTLRQLRSYPRFLCKN
jgi:hypothetical protein